MRIPALPSAGMLALAAFVVCAASGAALGLVFDPGRGEDALAQILLHNPWASIARALHWWSAQAAFVLALWHAVQHIRRSGDSRLPPQVWLRATLGTAALAWAMLSGFLLRGDPAAQQALRACDGVLRSVPLLGEHLAGLLLGPDGGGHAALYMHHIAIATILAWLATVEHARR
ncbi:MAG: hypothetical protein J0M02_10560, partial [Planctomycetes bacterium]|nr:hypothetical protein [Planctomycetota bacterium]